MCKFAVSIFLTILCAFPIEGNATVIICNDSKFKCYEIHRLEFNDTFKNACCWDFNLTNSSYDCVDDCAQVRGVREIEEVDNSGIEIINGELLIDGEKVGDVVSPELPNNLSSISYKEFDMEGGFERLIHRETILQGNKLIIDGEEVGQISGVDLNSKISFTEIIRKDVRASKDNITIFPNPVNDNFRVIAPENIISFSLYDFSMRLVRENIDVSRSVKMEALPPGTYFAVFTDNENKKIIKKISKI